VAAVSLVDMGPLDRTAGEFLVNDVPQGMTVVRVIGHCAGVQNEQATGSPAVVGDDGGRGGLAFADALHLWSMERIKLPAALALLLRADLRGPAQREGERLLQCGLKNLRETQNSLIEAEKLAALGRPVAGVAYEISNPLGTGLTVASSLERKSELFASEVAQGTLKRSSLNEFVEAIRNGPLSFRENLNRAARLVQSFKQVASDRNNSELRSFDLGDLTEQVATGLRPALPKHGVTLNVECQRDLSMSSYPGSYGRVLTNLFLNSIAHAFPDGQQGNIAIKVSASGANDVEVIFTDDSCGMSPDVRRQAFDPFFTTRRHQGCAGLGLHIVYSVVTIGSAAASISRANRGGERG
jgi:C4-dicarboxylate-specific signal transduction histidine kinase